MLLLVVTRESEDKSHDELWFEMPLPEAWTVENIKLFIEKLGEQTNRKIQGKIAERKPHARN